MDTITLWRDQRTPFRSFANDHREDAEAVGERFGEVLDAIRLEIMSRETNTLKQQIIGLLFAQARQGTDWLSRLGQVTSVRTGEAQPAAAADSAWFSAGRFPARLWAVARNPLFTLIALGVIVVLAVLDHSYVAAGIAALLFAGGYLTYDPFRKSSPLPAAAPEPRVALNADALMAVLDARMESLGHYLEDLAILDDSQKTASEAPKWLLETVQRIWEAGLNRQPEDCIRLCRDLLVRYRLRAVDYDGANGAMFQWLRSSGDTAMVCPAICRLDGGALVQYGQAISPNPGDMGSPANQPAAAQQ